MVMVHDVNNPLPHIMSKAYKVLKSMHPHFTGTAEDAL
jgi:hypothetical protein